MTLASQVVCLDLARKLKELGVKQESLFAWVDGGVQGDSVIRMTEEKVSLVEASQWKDYVYSAFTVAELGTMLGDFWCGKQGDQFHCRRFVHERDESTQVADTEADSRAKMLIHLIEQKMVTP